MLKQVINLDIFYDYSYKVFFFVGKLHGDVMQKQ